MRNQVDRIKSAPFLSKDIPVYGFIYDVRKGTWTVHSCVNGDNKFLDEKLEQLRVHVDGVILCAVILVELPASLLLAVVGTQLLLAITVTAIAIEVQIPLLQNSKCGELRCRDTDVDEVILLAGSGFDSRRFIIIFNSPSVIS